MEHFFVLFLLKHGNITQVSTKVASIAKRTGAWFYSPRFFSVSSLPNTGRTFQMLPSIMLRNK
jgi:hypothetical protein